MTMTQAELFQDAPVGRQGGAVLPWAVRQLVLARDHWACLCCDQSVLGRRYAIHLRKPWHLGGDASPENLITVLAECGERISADCDPADEARGYIVGSCDEPALVPVMYSTPAGLTRAWLLPDGGRTFEPRWIGVRGDLKTAEYDPSMSERKTRVTVTIDPGLAAYVEQLVESGQAPSVSAVVNDALEARRERDRRIARRWNEVIAGASDEDRAKAARMMAHVDAQLAKLPPSHSFR
jgi:Arc/MetJ-type ribon-helix-helix transcriptional regulator